MARLGDAAATKAIELRLEWMTRGDLFNDYYVARK